MLEAVSAPRVVVVLVAFNRRDLLAEALDAVANQSVAPVATVVVDNGSDDDSALLAQSHPLSPDVVSLGVNTGGAGGFAAGIARALARHDPDWLWLMDDDTVPTESALAELIAAVSGRPDVVVAGSRVVWTTGEEHPMNTPRRNPFASCRERALAERDGLLPVRSSSFVSMLARSDVVRRRGLPVADFFIWNDDFEYSTRLLRGHRGVFVPGSVVVHKTRVLGSTDADPGERFFYEVRNKVWMWRFSRGLNPFEKLVYGASTVRRWLRTMRRSRQPELLRDCFRRGWRHGWRTRPRPTAALLGGIPAIADDVRSLEGGVGRA